MSAIGSKKTFIRCEKCKKRLIERLPNGLWKFIFGRRRRKDTNGDPLPLVEMYIHGALKIKCLRSDCDHEMILNYFPNSPPVDFTKKTATQSAFPEVRTIDPAITATKKLS